MMLSQSRHVFEIFMGRDSGWNPQRRDGGGTSWGEAWHYHMRDTLIAAMTGVILWFLSPPLLAWVSPALLGIAARHSLVARERLANARQRAVQARASCARPRKSTCRLW